MLLFLDNIQIRIGNKVFLAKWWNSNGNEVCSLHHCESRFTALLKKIPFQLHSDQFIQQALQIPRCYLNCKQSYFWFVCKRTTPIATILHKPNSRYHSCQFLNLNIFLMFNYLRVWKQKEVYATCIFTGLATTIVLSL